MKRTMKRVLNHKQTIIELLVIALFGFVPLLWFKDGQLAAGHDMSYPLAPIDFWLDRLFVWTDRAGGFGVNQTDALPTVFIHGLQALFYSITNDLQLAQKLDFCVWFVLPGITMYILLKSLHPKKEDFIIRISGSLFYILNHYLLQAWIIAEMSKFSMVAAIPLVVLAIINVLLRNGSILKNSILVGITLFFLNGGAGIPLWGGMLVAAGTSMMIAFLVSPYPPRKRVRSTILFSVLSLIFILILNIYWLYPYISSFQLNYVQRLETAGGSEGALSWSRDISKNSSFTNLIKLQGIPDWYQNSTHPYSNIILGNYFFIFLAHLFPALAFLSLLKGKYPSKNSTRFKAIFLGIVIVAIPFTAGSYPPTGILYDLALKYIPGFSIFRTPFYKFGMALWFAYSYLIAIGLKNLVEYLSKNFSKIGKNSVRFVVATVFVVLLGIYNYPAFTGQFFHWSDNYSTMVKVPEYIFEAKKELDANKFSNRVLMVPPVQERNKYITYDWRYYSLSTVTRLLSRRPVLVNDVSLINLEPALVNGIYEQLSEGYNPVLIKYAGVDRVLLQNDFVPYVFEPYNIEQYKKSVRQSSHFELEKNIGEWDFYKYLDTDILPLFYIPQNLSYIDIDDSVLSVVSDMPGQDLGDAIFFENNSEKSVPNNVLSTANFQANIVQAECIDCEEERTVNIFIPDPPLVMPTNPMYGILKLINDYKFNQLTTPEEKVDFVLGNINKEVSAMNVVITNPKNFEVVNNLLSGWLNDIEKIRQYMDGFDNSTSKEVYMKRASDHYWFFLTRTQKWRELQLTQSTIKNLDRFEDTLSEYSAQLQTSTRPESQEFALNSKSYKVNVPDNGNYLLALYNYKPQDSDEILVEIQNNQYLFSKQEDSKNWYFGKEISLNKGESNIFVPEIVKRERTYSDTVVNAGPGETKCGMINLGAVERDIAYNFSFNYSTIFNELNEFKIHEYTSGDDHGEDVPLSIQSNRNELSPSLYNASFTYLPSKNVNKALFEVCTGGHPESNSTIEMTGMKLVENYPDHLVFLVKSALVKNETRQKVEFVSLNQTAYLVRVAGVDRDFILNFNERYDPSWKIRKVDSTAANKYFTGETKTYLDGSVVEYERHYGHKLLGREFDNKDSVAADISLNTFSNAWVVSENPNETVYLVEHTLQRSVYKVAVVSIVGLIIMLLASVRLIMKGRNEG